MSQAIDRIPESVRNSMQEVTNLQILEMRVKPKKFAVFADNGKFYIYSGEKANIIKIRSVMGKHLCSDCANFYDEKTRKLCPKVADPSSKDDCRAYTNSDFEALVESKRIEKYPFIKEGLECVNYSKGFFTVTECSRFKACKQIDRLDADEIAKMWFEREID